MRTIEHSRDKMSRLLYICTYGCLFFTNVCLVSLPFVPVQSPCVLLHVQTRWVRLKPTVPFITLQPHGECNGFLIGDL